MNIAICMLIAVGAYALSYPIFSAIARLITFWKERHHEHSNQ
jgi:hypothetical protein